MLDIVFQHSHATANVGDAATCPQPWFAFGPSLVQNFGQAVPPCRVAVLGGGQVFGKALEAAFLHTRAAHHRVAWGLGIHPVNPQSFDYASFLRQMTLVGARDHGLPGTEYVPCASCMSVGFDAVPPPEHDVVLFLHARKSERLQRPEGIPVRDNHTPDLTEALRFIASGATVVSNSYHGVYWAMLMGRRVLALPYSAKFNGFRQMPAVADAGDWLGDLARAKPVEGVLEEARVANRAFFTKVMALD